MKTLSCIVTLVILLALGTVPLEAHCMEVGFKITDGEGNLLSIAVTVYERNGGDFVQSAQALATAGPEGCNFFIDYNTNCYNGYIVNLDVGTEYVIKFHYPSSLGGVKSLCFVREYCSPTSYDTFYEVTPTDVIRFMGTCEEDAWGYPNCQPILPPGDLAVSLQIIDTDFIGDKVIYTLRATASGGSPNDYTFRWYGAAMISPSSHTNPNVARRTILKSQTTTVRVVVTSGSETVEKQITLRGDLRIR